MTYKRKNLINKQIASLKNNKDLKVSLINGIFGAGKSEFVNEMKTAIIKENLSDAVIHFNVGTNKNFLVDYILDNDVEFINDDSAFLNYDFSECTYNKTRFYQLLLHLKEENQEQKSSCHDLFSMRRLPAPAENKNKIDEIGNLIEKKSDKLLLLKNDRAVTEALIVDLLNLICPLNADRSSYSSYLEHLTNPYKIIMIFDNLDNHYYSIIKWLNEEFIPVCINGKINDFVCFYPSEKDTDLKISDLIDFKFIISSRINPLVSSDLSCLSKFNIKYEQIELELFDSNETKEYLRNKKIEDDELSYKIHQYSYGIPYLIDLLTDNNDEINEITRDNAYQIFSSKFLDCEDKYFVEAIKFGSILNQLDVETLECNKTIQGNEDRLFDLLVFSNDIFLFDGKSIKLKEPIKTIVSKSLDRNNKSLVLEYQYIAKVIEIIKNKIENLSYAELKILRSLAYFNRFDSKYAIGNAFDDKAESAMKFINDNNAYVKKNKHTYSINENLIEPLNEYNRIIDREKYDLKKQLVDRIWAERRNELITEKESLSLIISNNDNIYNELLENPSRVKQEYENHQRSFIEVENELIKIKKSLEELSPVKFLPSLVVNISAGILSFLIAYFFPVIFSTQENQSSVVIIQYILFFISCVFLFISFSFLYKMLKLLLNKKEKQKIIEKIKEKEKESAEHQNQMNKLRDLSLNGQKQMKEISEKLYKDKKRLIEIDSLLSEPYIF